ncbi:probable receptor-like protein kinase At5g38990 [Helianthus annuus]|uniref:probable receptor-like protein kinase At5g38990 n=1 Tax=Helianthus annuus TaxID=4232 RepID=UPI001652F3CB|nr:probable receptor-like protein kinase At5g38990 [Helianthus annuus]
MAITSEQLCRRYSLPDIQLATKNFDEERVIGHGGFGKVYKGHIDEERGGSTSVAIKRLDSMSNQGAPEFTTEVEMLSKLRHAHLVSLLGCCDDGEEMILVYEYMPNGTLYHHLHNSNTPLSWMQRLRIWIGAARGLDHLHTGPTGQRRQCDVNGLGLLLMEILTGKPAPSDYMGREHWSPKVALAYVEDLVDPRMRLKDTELERARELLSLILKCTSYHYTMEQALKELEQIYSRMKRRFF